MNKWFKLSAFTFTLLGLQYAWWHLGMFEGQGIETFFTWIAAFIVSSMILIALVATIVKEPDGDDT